MFFVTVFINGKGNKNIYITKTINRFIQVLEIFVSDYRNYTRRCTPWVSEENNHLPQFVPAYEEWLSRDEVISKWQYCDWKWKQLLFYFRCDEIIWPWKHSSCWKPESYYNKCVFSHLEHKTNKNLITVEKI